MECDGEVVKNTSKSKEKTIIIVESETGFIDNLFSSFKNACSGE